MKEKNSFSWFIQDTGMLQVVSGLSILLLEYWNSLQFPWSNVAKMVIFSNIFFYEMIKPTHEEGGSNVCGIYFNQNSDL